MRCPLGWVRNVWVLNISYGRGERIKESIPFRRAEDEKVRRVDPVILLVADSQAALLAHNVLSAECLDISPTLLNHYTAFNSTLLLYFFLLLHTTTRQDR